MKPQQVAAAAGGKKALNLNKMLICESTENGPIWTNLYLSLSFSLPPYLFPWDNFVAYIHTLRLRAATYGHIWQLYCLVRGITIFISIFICSELNSSLCDLFKELVQKQILRFLHFFFKYSSILSVSDCEERIYSWYNFRNGQKRVRIMNFLQFELGASFWSMYFGSFEIKFNLNFHFSINEIGANGTSRGKEPTIWRAYLDDDIWRGLRRHFYK